MQLRQDRQSAFSLNITGMHVLQGACAVHGNSNKSWAAYSANWLNSWHNTFLFVTSGKAIHRLPSLSMEEERVRL
jgi:hypothetical protein